MGGRGRGRGRARGNPVGPVKEEPPKPGQLQGIFFILF